MILGFHHLFDAFDYLPKPLDLPDGDTWTVWDGGECPVPRGARVEIRLRNGDLCRCHAEVPYWRHCADWPDQDVVAYRIINGEKTMSDEKDATAATAGHTPANLIERLQYIAGIFRGQNAPKKKATIDEAIRVVKAARSGIGDAG